MSEKGRVVAIFGVVGLALAGGLFYFFKIHQPHQQQAAAQAEVVAWEQRFKDARTCLLGPSPASSKAREALAVREMQPDPWERKTCTQLMGKLSRGVTEDTGLMNVEHAWMTIDRAASKVANAFAMHVDPFGESEEVRSKESPLPGALEELDAAHADLRKAAGMGPPPDASLPSLAPVEMIELKLGSEPVAAALDAWTLPSADGAIAFGSVKSKGQVQLLLAAGAAPKVLPVANGALRAVPALNWGATALMTEVDVAPIDDNGAFGTITTFAAPNGARVLATVGSFTNGLVAYTEGTKLTIVRSSGGPFVADKPIDGGMTTIAVDLSGRTLVAWSGTNTMASDTDGAIKGFITRGDAAPKIVDLGSGYPGSSCLTSTKGWVAQSAQAVSFDDAGSVPHALPGHDLLGCSKDAALLQRGGTSHYAVCKDTCRSVDITNLKSTHVATIANDKVHAIRSRENVLGVWRENLPPLFFSMTTAVTPIIAMSDGKVIDVLGTTATGLVIVRAPIK